MKFLPMPIGFLAVHLFLLPAGLADDKQEAEDNVPPQGFTALFNGKDLTNWQGLIEIHKRAKMEKETRAAEQKKADARTLPHWTVNDGILEYDGKANNLQTAKDYGNFELLVDWKIAPKGDSGIYLRGNPQVQIWDNPVGSGGLYNNAQNPKDPLKKADKPTGEWNHFRIVMKGDRVSVWLNGVLVVDDTPLENYWEKDKPLPAKGPIELQHHGDRLWFKNIYIKELPSSGWGEADLAKLKSTLRDLELTDNEITQIIVDAQAVEETAIGLNEFALDPIKANGLKGKKAKELIDTYLKKLKNIK
jgi:hypothetical protein